MAGDGPTNRVARPEGMAAGAVAASSLPVARSSPGEPGGGGAVPPGTSTASAAPSAASAPNAASALSDPSAAIAFGDPSAAIAFGARQRGGQRPQQTRPHHRRRRPEPTGSPRFDLGPPSRRHLRASLRLGCCFMGSAAARVPTLDAPWTLGTATDVSRPGLQFATGFTSPLASLSPRAVGLPGRARPPRPGISRPGDTSRPRRGQCRCCRAPGPPAPRAWTA